VALFFAVRAEPDWGGKPDRDGALWLMELKEYEDRKEKTVHLEMNERLVGEAEYPQLVVTPAFTRRIEVQHGRFTYTSSAKPLNQIPRTSAPWIWIDSWRVDATGGSLSLDKIFGCISDELPGHPIIHRRPAAARVSYAKPAGGRSPGLGTKVVMGNPQATS
jgi:hypothetical protein